MDKTLQKWIDEDNAAAILAMDPKSQELNGREDDNEELPVVYAVRREKFNAAAALVKAGASPYQACGKEQESASVLLDHLDEKELLKKLILNDDYETILCLVGVVMERSLAPREASEDDVYGNEAPCKGKDDNLLNFALLRGKLRSALALITLGADINERSPSDGMSARDLMKNIEEHPYDLEIDWDQPETCGHLARLLIAMRMPITTKMPQGRTALHMAALFNQKEIVRQFIDDGAPLEDEDDNDQTPLLIAVSHGNIDIARMLLDAGVQVNYHKGYPPLVKAAKMGDLDMAQLLISARADLTLTTKGSGQSALHAATANGQVAMAKLLVAAGANINARNADGETPLSIALKYRDLLGLATYFQELGAKI